MSINTAIIAHGTIVTTGETVDCLLDAMVEAQRRVGQITWDTITTEAAHGTYTNDGEKNPIVVVDTNAHTDLLATIEQWMNR
jgi:hypothetical protein